MIGLTSTTLKRSFVTNLLSFTAPTLILLSAVVPFVRFHEVALSAEGLALLALSMAFGGVLGAICVLWRELEPTVVTLCVAATVLPYDSYYTAADLASQMVGASLPVATVVIVTGALCALRVLAGLLRRNLAVLTSVVSGVIIVSTIVIPPARDGRPKEAGGISGQLRDLPPVIHIILDEHIGLAGLPRAPERVNEVAQQIRSTYRDFLLYGSAYSNFSETQFSLASVLNAKAGSDLTDLFESQGSGYRLKENRWFQKLSMDGYAIKVYQSSYLDLCSASQYVNACYTYSYSSPTSLQNVNASFMLKTSALLSKFFLARVQFGPTGAIGALSRFKEDISRHKAGVAYVMHLLIPHQPYMLREDCSLADSANWELNGEASKVTVNDPTTKEARYELYLSQLTCTSRLMSDLFGYLRELSIYADATIIVHGDHGSRIAETRPLTVGAGVLLSKDGLIDYYSTLFAIKKRSVTPGVVPDPVSLLELARNHLGVGATTHSGSPGTVWIRGRDGVLLEPRTLPWMED